MTTSQQMSFLSEVLDADAPIPNDTLVYFRERLRHRIHAAIVEAFIERAKRNKNLNQKLLADRIHRSESHVSRLLSSARNLTIDMVSDMMVGLAMDFDKFPRTPIEDTLMPAESSVEITAERNKAITNYIESLTRRIESTWNKGRESEQELGKTPDPYLNASSALPPRPSQQGAPL